MLLEKKDRDNEIKISEKIHYNEENDNFYYDNTIINFTLNEKKVLTILLSSVATVVHHDEICFKIWGTFGQKQKNNLKSIINSIKKKANDLKIDNIYKVGYLLERRQGTRS